VELTPGERQRIYLEEKERLTAQQQLRAEQARETSRKKAAGCLTLVLIIAVGFIIVYFVASLAPKTAGASQPDVGKPADPAYSAQFETDFKKLMLSQVVTSVDANEPTPRVFVGAGWYQLTYQQKVAAAKLISDYWADLHGEPHGGAMFVLCDANSGQVLYEWDYFELRQP
jgi:hypothetical protein